MKLVSRLFGIALLLMLLSGVSSGANPPPRSHKTVIDIRIDENGDMAVKETCYFSDGPSDMLRFWLRHMPISYIDPDGKERRIPFDIVSLTLDGEDMPYSRGRDVENIILHNSKKPSQHSIGSHKLEFEYKTARHFYNFSHHQELYYEVMGPEWFMMLDSLTINVYLPTTKDVIGYDSHCGGVYTRTKCEPYARKVSEKHFQFGTYDTERNSISFGVEMRFPINTFPARNNDEFSLRYFLMDHAPVVSLFGFSLLVFIYFMWAWNKWGMGPDPQKLRSRRKPPKNVGPGMAAFMHYLDNNHYGSIGAVLYLADKGAIKIRQDDDEIILEETAADTEELSIPEAFFLNALFSRYSEITIGPDTYNAWFRRAIKLFRNKLSQESSRKQLFSHNVKYWIPGFLLSIIGAIVSGSLLFDRYEMPIFFLSCFLAASFSHAVFNLLLVKANKGMQLSATIVFLLSFGIVTSFTVAISFVVGLETALGFILLMGQAGLFYRLMAAPSKYGRKILDQLDAYKTFLKEGNKPVPESAKEFSEHLPYAVALGVKNHWVKQFQGHSFHSDEQISWFVDYKGSQEFGDLLGNNGERFLNVLLQSVIRSSSSGEGRFSTPGFRWSDMD